MNWNLILNLQNTMVQQSIYPSGAYPFNPECEACAAIGACNCVGEKGSRVSWRKFNWNFRISYSSKK